MTAATTEQASPKPAAPEHDIYVLHATDHGGWLLQQLEGTRDAVSDLESALKVEDD